MYIRELYIHALILHKYICMCVRVCAMSGRCGGRMMSTQEFLFRLILPEANCIV